MDYVLKTYNLSKKYGRKFAVQGVNLNIKKGDIYGFIGKNGAGKTSLIRMITGLSSITNGGIELFGQDSPKDIINGRKRIGSLIENPAFYSNMTACENMELLRLQKGIPGKKCIEEKLALVGLDKVEKKKIKNFSLGMKQKLGIAMALLGDPEFLILDEPTNGLDPMGIIELRELLKQLNSDKGITILISSHILGELSQLATCYGIINNGELVEEISSDELNERCKTSLEIKVNNVNKAAWVIENILNTNNFKVLPGRIIRLYDYINNPGEVSKNLLNNDVIVEELSVKGENLESYFMGLLGGRKDD
ncbi:ATP-binding cassette domain-containing protein [Clostridium sp. B9]|uniref:ATP-binding cassette domain-containing protein n=1 Tax=Clostridium sp. B9 TaxID=3423224 RepID=UPI003D2EEFF6